MSRAIWVQLQQGAETLCSPLAIFAALSNESPLNLLSWISSVANLQSRADRVLTLNMNILPLLLSTWSLARGQDSATCVGLAHGCD